VQVCSRQWFVNEVQPSTLPPPALNPANTHRTTPYARRLREPQYRVGSERPTYWPRRKASGYRPLTTDKPQTSSLSVSHEGLLKKSDAPLPVGRGVVSYWLATRDSPSPRGFDAPGFRHLSATSQDDAVPAAEP
jgi:hypothetical protein